MSDTFERIVVGLKLQTLSVSSLRLRLVFYGFEKVKGKRRVERSPSRYLLSQSASFDCASVKIPGSDFPPRPTKPSALPCQ